MNHRGGISIESTPAQGTPSHARERRWRLAPGLLLLAFSGAFAADATPPRPPCGGADPVPAYGAASDPAIATWSKLEWAAPACLGWTGARYKFVIAVAGRIDAPDAAVLRGRLGAVSASRGLVYWSVTESAWRVLIKDAAALAGAEGPRRDDFAPAELREGATLHFVEQDNRSDAPVTYAMHVLESRSDRIVVETANVTPIKALLLTLFPPGALRTAYVLTRLESRTWGLYVISAATEQASGTVSLARSSYENRARALFAHFAQVTIAYGQPPRWR